MSNFNNKTITSKGLELLSSALAGNILEFTRIVMGSGTYEGDIGLIESLVNQKQSLDIKSITRKGSQVVLSTTLLQNAIIEDFYWKEIGIYAKVSGGLEILYMYGSADEASYISKNMLNEKMINVGVLVSNAQNVTATIDESLLYVSSKDLANHNNDVEAHSAIRTWVQGLFNSLKLTWDNITGKPNTFPPPVASSTVLGGVKQGNHITIEADGTISGAAPYTHPNTHPASMITGLPTSLPANGGNADTVDGTHAWYMQTLSASGTTHGASEWLAKIQHNVDSDSYFKLVCGDGGIGVKVDNTNLVKGRDLSAELDSLKSTVVSGKQSVANAINGKLGTSLSNQTPFDDMAYYISNGLISSPTSATCGSFTLTFGNNFSTRSCYIVRSSYKVYCYSLYGVAVSYQVYKKPSGGSLSLLYSGTISTASPSYTQLTDGDNTAVYFIFFGTSGVTLHATNTNGSGNATFDYCI